MTAIAPAPQAFSDYVDRATTDITSYHHLVNRPSAFVARPRSKYWETPYVL
jgi:hypothetical protein